MTGDGREIKGMRRKGAHECDDYTILNYLLSLMIICISMNFSALFGQFRCIISVHVKAFIALYLSEYVCFSIVISFFCDRFSLRDRSLFYL